MADGEIGIDVAEVKKRKRIWIDLALKPIESCALASAIQ